MERIFLSPLGASELVFKTMNNTTAYVWDGVDGQGLEERVYD